jgi:hypothetical protein
LCGYVYYFNDKNGKIMTLLKKSYIEIRASLKTRLIKEKADRYGRYKEIFRRRALALQGRLTQYMSCIDAFSQKEFLEMPII